MAEQHDSKPEAGPRARGRLHAATTAPIGPSISLELLNQLAVLAYKVKSLHALARKWRNTVLGRSTAELYLGLRTARSTCRVGLASDGGGSPSMSPPADGDHVEELMARMRQLESILELSTGHLKSTHSVTSVLHELSGKLGVCIAHLESTAARARAVSADPVLQACVNRNVDELAAIRKHVQGLDSLLYELAQAIVTRNSYLEASVFAEIDRDFGRW